MIEIKNISKAYGENLVLNHLDITFNEGEISMLLGPSGCGKSTLLKLINRLIDPDSGTILINGKPTVDSEVESLRRNIGYAIQGVGLFPHMTVAENIAVVPKLLKWDKDKIEDRTNELVELVGLPMDYLNKMPSQLSGGEAQRVGVARALAADPPILLMDEPFGALDPITRERLQTEFMEIQQKLQKTVIFVTHDVGEAVKMADHLVILNDGKIQAAGHPEDIAFQGDAVTRSFLGDHYTLELLAKHVIGDFPSLFTEEHSIDAPISKVILDETSTFKDVISAMFSEGKSQISLQKLDAYYVISFNQLMTMFRGGRI